jgi:flagellar hook-length control protein FliK
MQENVLMGKIVVDNSAVRDVFEQNLPQLIRSFEEAGWETGSLDVSVSDGETDGRREQDGSGSMRGRTAVKEDLSEHRYTVEDRGLVDLMA